MGISKKAKKGLIITAIVVGTLVLIFGGVNAVYAILASQEQTGTAKGYEWNADMAFDQKFVDDHVKTIDIGEGDFPILGITDIQRKNGGTAVKFLGINHILDWVSEPQIRGLVKETKPKLILVGGDNVANKNNDIEMKHFVNFMDSFKIPWATIFGNHDDEGRADKAKLCEVLQDSEYSLFEYGPQDVHGVGNYIINLNRGDEIVYSIYAMDSGTHVDMPDGTRPYDGLNKKQVEWYTWATNGMNALNGGKLVKSMAWYHIPLPEYSEITEFIDGTRSYEPYASGFNDGFFDAFKAQGGTHMFVGHDHENNFIADYQGVIMTYVTKSSYNGSFIGSLTGGNTITVKADNTVEVKIVKF